jgi:hypothetical protein
MWKNRLPGRWSTKNRTNVKKLVKRLQKFQEKAIIFLKGDQLVLLKTGRIKFFLRRSHFTGFS